MKVAVSSVENDDKVKIIMNLTHNFLFKNQIINLDIVRYNTSYVCD